MENKTKTRNYNLAKNIGKRDVVFTSNYNRAFTDLMPNVRLVWSN